jgi:hypothetical protein
VRFDLSKGKGIKGASVFRTDLNDHLIPITSFLDCHNLCENRCHDWQDADFPKRERTTLEKVPLTEKNK